MLRSNQWKSLMLCTVLEKDNDVLTADCCLALLIQLSALQGRSCICHAVKMELQVALKGRPLASAA